MSSVTLKNLSKSYGNVLAVNDLNLKIEEKEFLVLLGPSGCGKTTTLRCIAGLESADSGEILIGDRVVNDLDPHERDIAMVFQSYALYPHMKVRDNMGFPLKMRKLPKADIEKKVNEIAGLLKITHLLDRKPSQLSGGEAQRTALGRAMVRNPKVFLMDEPLSNLDAKLRIYMRAELRRLQKDFGITMIYVTHDQVEAMTMADRVAIMHNGLLQQLGTSDEIYDHPSNAFVAGFIGSPPMNFLDCTLIEKNGAFFLDGGSFTLEIPSDIGKVVKKESSSSEVKLGIRPEDMYIEEKRTPNASIKGEVYVVEPLGSEVLVDLRIGENLAKAKVSPSCRPEINDEVWIGINEEKMHVIDSKTERVII